MTTIKSTKTREHCMSNNTRDILIAQLTNLKNLNKQTVSLDIDFVLKALSETAELPKPKPIYKSKMNADAGQFKD